MTTAAIMLRVRMRTPRHPSTIFSSGAPWSSSPCSWCVMTTSTHPPFPLARPRRRVASQSTSAPAPAPDPDPAQPPQPQPHPHPLTCLRAHTNATIPAHDATPADAPRARMIALMPLDLPGLLGRPPLVMFFFSHAIRDSRPRYAMLSPTPTPTPTRVRAATQWLWYSASINTSHSTYVNPEGHKHFNKQQVRLRSSPSSLACQSLASLLRKKCGKRGTVEAPHARGNDLATAVKNALTAISPACYA